MPPTVQDGAVCIILLAQHTLPRPLGVTFTSINNETNCLVGDVSKLFDDCEFQRQKAALTYYISSHPSTLDQPEPLGMVCRCLAP